MADEKDRSIDEGQETEAAPKKGNSMMLIVIIIVGVLVLGGAAFFAVKMLGSSDKKDEVKKEEPSAMLVMEPFVVNLYDPSGARFLKVSIQIELASAAILEIAKTKTPQLRDSVITLLTSKTADAVMSPEGKLQIKDEISLRATQVIGEKSVKNVFLTDFVMQ
ncbi:MAG: flagellar basal body-associated FliL family protein [Dissulfurispiraceae bacterium]|nr:flagellar basal body-associated FliL family protein [Dissulfurispiraceae bacterium]